MIKRLTYKQKIYASIILVFLAFILVYKIAIKPTIVLASEYKEKEELLISLSTAPQEIKLMSAKLESLNEQLSTKDQLGIDIREDLLSVISNYCEKNRIVVFSYPEQHIYETSSFAVETNRIILKGTFKRLLKLVHYLETETAFSRIVSINYYTSLNRKTKREELYLELIFQNMKDHE